MVKKMVKQDVKENKYKVLEIEIVGSEGKVKTYKKGRVMGDLLLEFISFKAGLDKHTHNLTKKLKVENKGITQEEIDAQIESSLVSEFGMLTKMADMVVKSFRKNGEEQFTREELIAGIEADELVEKLQFYFENAISNNEIVGADTEDFLNSEKVAETEDH